MSSKFLEKKISSDLYKSQKACEQLDMAKVINTNLTVKFVVELTEICQCCIYNNPFNYVSILQSVVTLSFWFVRNNSSYRHINHIVLNKFVVTLFWLLTNRKAEKAATASSFQKLVKKHFFFCSKDNFKILLNGFSQFIW